MLLPKVGRRSFLKVLGAAPVAAPLAMKKAAEDAAAQLSHLATNGLDQGCAAPSVSNNSDWHNKVKQAIALGGKKKIIDQLYREHKWVSALDADIAVLKAPSLSAKIAWQRKRNVERKFSEMIEGYSWDQLDKLVNSITGFGL